MKITQVYVEVGVKKTQDYNSCNNAVGLTGLLEGDDDPDAIVKQLQEHGYKLLFKKFFPAVPARPAG